MRLYAVLNYKLIFNSCLVYIKKSISLAGDRVQGPAHVQQTPHLLFSGMPLIERFYPFHTLSESRWISSKSNTKPIFQPYCSSCKECSFLFVVKFITKFVSHAQVKTSQQIYCDLLILIMQLIFIFIKKVKLFTWSLNSIFFSIRSLILFFITKQFLMFF